MKIGDLVRHKFDGGVGIIIKPNERWSRTTMTTADKHLVRWIEPPQCQRQGYKYVKENLYYLGYLEVISQADKK